MRVETTEPVPDPGRSWRAPLRRGRPRSDEAQRAILDAARELLVAHGFSHLCLEHVAARAGVGKATIYRRWHSKEDLALAVAMELAAPHLVVDEADTTRAELLATVRAVLHALNETSFGPVMRALVSEIATNPRLGDPFRATVVETRRAEVTKVIERGIARGDLRPGADASVATELLIGSLYYRLLFGGELGDSLAEELVEAFLHGYAAVA
jgi:AcrR family transcriptional regulator